MKPLLSDAQAEALKLMLEEPQKRGIFNSGWGPRHFGHAAHRVDIREATANKLISLGFAERRDVEGDRLASTIHITDAGRAALAEHTGG